MNHTNLYYHLNINQLSNIKLWMRLAKKYPHVNVIVAVTEKVAQHLGGLEIVKNHFDHYQKQFKLTNILLHLDHGKTSQICLKAIQLGFDAVMFDGSWLPIKIHLEQAQIVSKAATNANVYLELEVGKIQNNREQNHFSRLKDIILLINNVRFDWLAISIGNYHGLKPNDQAPELDFNLLKQIKKITNKKLVLHGASGIPFDTLKEAIKWGIGKINFDSILQKAFRQAIKHFYKEEKFTNFQNWLIDLENYLQDKIYHQAENILKKIIY